MTVVKVTLDIGYAFVQPHAGYYGLFPSKLDWTKLVEGYVLLGIGCATLPTAFERPSSQCAWILALLALLPMTTIYAFRAESRPFMYAVAAMFVELGLLLRYIPELRVPPRPRWIPNRTGIYMYAALLVSCVGVLLVSAGPSIVQKIGRLGGDLSGAYADRAEFTAAGLPLHGYYFHWTALIFNPYFLMLSLIRRLWWVIVPISVLQLLIGSEVGARAYFGALPFILLVGWLAASRNPAAWLSLAAAGLVGIVGIWWAVTGQSFPYKFVVDRFLLLPAQLNFLYYQFFSEHGLIPGAYILKFYFRLPDPFAYPYKVAPDFLIGIRYYGAPDLAAISGFIGDGFMNLGFLGLALWSAGIAFLFRLIDVCAAGLDRRLSMALLTMPIVALTETYTIRVLITTGLLLGMLLMYVAARSSPASTTGGEFARARSTGPPAVG